MADGLQVTVTGGCGYIGAVACAGLKRAGHGVRALDSLIHGQQQVAQELRDLGVEVIEADVRDGEARARALDGADAVVHLAAIVGDPACARQPDLAREVNLEGANALIDDAVAAGVGRFVFASTCSNYGRMSDPTVPIDESGELAPLSLYAEQKVEIEKRLLGGVEGLDATCLRLATIYGAAPRMRFDLTVNEFTRELWADRKLEVYGEYFWRPYVHVADAARAILTVVERPVADVSGEVFNVGDSDENYRKIDLVEAIVERLGRGDVTYVSRDEDPRDYKVAFAKIKDALGFEVERRVPDGIDEIVAGLESEGFGDPFSPAYRNVSD